MYSSESPIEWEEIGGKTIDDVISSLGFDIPLPLVNNGQVQRFSTNGEASDTAGFYFWSKSKFHIGDWRQGKGWKWSDGVTTGEAETDKEETDRLNTQLQELGLELTKALWEGSEFCDIHPYLEAKNLVVIYR